MSHRIAIAQSISTLVGNPDGTADGSNSNELTETTKNGLIEKIKTTDPSSPEFSRLSQLLTEMREKLRKLEKLLEQENQYIMMRLKSGEANNGAVFR